MASDKIEVENVNSPGKTTRVDAAKYAAMRAAMLAVMPTGAPGLTAAEIKDRAKPRLPEDLFPGGATSGWWLKCVQLDLEAKGVIQRHATKPLTFSQVQ
ncbi:DUF6958 family protein [Sinisalibacter aestuarii]|uniref:Uncharacterized protein n=1 Tax=Sinisalibacter aestuarii TaxID=2949426 RepID=A0ABQ5LQI4_9RHOB|nr:hypothetical protein [Sinisalibacter aestuarii]GKY87267.1 hypothetical protein STA1M1_11360 [Sinisalibacter aestuarii]